jgi:GTP:adenosylcobinamide-phosphate guanylyltransferase
VRADAVVLAGGDGAVIDPAVPVKGLVPVAGKPMIEWVTDALCAAKTIAKVAVVVPTNQDLGAWAGRVDRVVVSDASFMDNALAGFSAMENGRPVLAVTGDLPALTPEAIDDFVTRSLASGAEFTYPLVSAADMERQFPGSRRTYVKVAGGRVTGGNMMLLSPQLVRRHRELGQRLFDARKSPIRMAQALGVIFIARYLSGELRIRDVERKMEQLLSVKCAAIRTGYAAIGADVDKPLDVDVAQRVLQGRTSGRNSPESELRA